MGVLGAARIAPAAVMKPAKAISDVAVTAIAARSRDRAQKFATTHGIPTVHDSYADVLADPDIDAVYIPLPNGAHGEWTLRAIAAGKHVLCEKPLTANAAEAEAVAAAAADSGLVLMEAFHYRYHPLARRVVEIVRGADGGPGQLGEIRRVETAMCFPLPRFSDIRYSYDLAGGATMDAGCYALHSARLVGPGEPEVTDAQATLLRRAGRPEVDRAMSIGLRFGNGATGRARTSLWSGTLFKIGIHVVGERGELKVSNFILPHLARITLTVDGRTSREKVPGDATYVYQMKAFAAAVRGADTNLTPPADSVANMRLIDAAYRAAGLPLRGPTTT
jgi:predicted dehydrogenase